MILRILHYLRWFLVDRAFNRIDDSTFDKELANIAELERVLSEDGTIVLKFWYHLSAASQLRILEEENQKEGETSPYLSTHTPLRNEFAVVSERAIRHTDQSYSPWHLIESEDARYRDIMTGEILLETLNQRLDNEKAWKKHAQADTFISTTQLPDNNRSVLDLVDLSATLDKDEYAQLLEFYQQKAATLGWQARKAGVTTISVFEGWDAAGKGGAIRRLTQAIDARLYRVISVAAPTDEEKARHYLWRFWRQIPRAGYHTIYDRSWYGRVLVERVEGFASHKEWFRAYHEINSFEAQLTDFGIVLMKFWLHMSPEEQLARFKARETIAWKMHKLTEEDWRNRERWGDYQRAVTEMVERTSTSSAPWYLIAANDKNHARIEILKTFCENLEKRLG